MRDVFTSYDAMKNSDFFKSLPEKAPQRTNRVLKSMRIEDIIYQDARASVEDILSEIEQAGIQKLPSISSLTRDVFQSLYAFTPQYTPESELTAHARKINLRILKDAMKMDDYPVLKSICEGRALPAMEATVEFMTRVLERLDDLMDSANGDKNVLGTLDKQEKAQDQRHEEFAKQNRQQQASSAPDTTQDKKLLRTGNLIHSKNHQLMALNQMVDDNLQRNKGMVHDVIDAAVSAAKDKADEAQSVILSWGNDPAQMDSTPENHELLQKVRDNDMLCKIARYLGRLKEMLRQKRKNSFAFGRGEKYSLELGNDLKSVISSEFSLLASPHTIPLFLRKHSKKNLKQYRRRERIYKGGGDIIVCLDESSSTRGENAAWGKAVALALQDVAKTDGRNFALVHFSSATDIKTDIFRPGKYTHDDLMAAATHFFDGGTDFETPMREAVRLMEQEGFHNADTVFITDGECKMSDCFVQNLKRKQGELSFTVTGILMDQDEPGMEFSLKPFCNELYRISELGGEGIANALLSSRI